MSKLKNLDLEGNPVQDTPEYKPEDIFTMIPSLEVRLTQEIQLL